MSLILIIIFDAVYLYNIVIYMYCHIIEMENNNLETLYAENNKEKLTNHIKGVYSDNVESFLNRKEENIKLRYGYVILIRFYDDDKDNSSSVFGKNHSMNYDIQRDLWVIDDISVINHDDKQIDLRYIDILESGRHYDALYEIMRLYNDEGYAVFIAGVNVTNESKIYQALGEHKIKYVLNQCRIKLRRY